MKFYRHIQNLTLHSFGDAIGDCPILGKKLSAYQEDFINQVGGNLKNISDVSKIPIDDSYFLFEENLFFSLPFLKSCIESSKTKKKNLRFCVGKSEYNSRYVLPHPYDTDIEHQFGFYYREGQAEDELCLIQQVVFDQTTEFPDQIIKGRKFHMHQSETFAMHIISPFHLLFANLAMNLARTAKFQAKIPVFLRNRFGKYNGKWFYRGLKKMNVLGKNCQIHPSAIIEGSVIGDNVIIGAQTIVRLSNIGNNAYISDNVSVINSVIGKQSFIANSNYVNSILCFKEVFLIHGPYQLSVFGENSACFAVINCDIRLDQETIKIPTSEGLLDSNQSILGIAYGHRSKTGGGNIIAAGRIVPNDLHIDPPDNIILSFKEQ